MKWTDEHRETVRRMAAAGISWRLIGAEVGRSGVAVEMYARKKMDIGPKPLAKQDYVSPIWTLIKRACADGQPRTVHEITEMVRCARSTVDRLMKKHAALGQAHVKAWHNRGEGSLTPLWLPFPGKSKRKPKPLGAIESQRRRRAKLKEEDPAKHQVMLARDYYQRAENGHARHERQVINDIFGRMA